MPPRHTTKVLPVVRRPSGDGFDVLAFRHPLAGCQLVKGSVDHDESIEGAAERELLEETGYRDPIGPCVRRRDTVYQSEDSRLAVVECGGAACAVRTAVADLVAGRDRTTCRPREI